MNLSDYWYNPSYSAAFTGLNSFYKFLKEKDINISKSDVKKWLSSQKTFSLYYPHRLKFKRNKTIAWGIGWMYSVDLAHIPDLKYVTSNHVWILVCIDSFSKYLWGKPMKTKKSEEVNNALREIFEERSPIYLYSDHGLEFWNSSVKKLCEEFNVHRVGSQTFVKAAHAEIAIKYLKRRIYKWSHNNLKPGKYLEALQKLIDGKNDTIHGAHGLKPKDVNLENQNVIFERLYPNFYNDKLKKWNLFLKIGDKVRLSKLRSSFQKGFRQNFTEEIFEIYQILRYRSPPTYKVKNLSGEHILGSFYSHDLVKIDDAPINESED